MLLSTLPRLVMPIIYTADCLGLLDAYSFLTEHLTGQQVAIFAYHRVGGPVYPWCRPSHIPVMPQEFENQIRYLCRTCEVIPLNKLVKHMQAKQQIYAGKTVAITFDDGYKDNYTYAYPILKKYNVSATIFLTTGYIGTGELFWWDKVSYVLQQTRLDSLALDEVGTYSLRSTRDRLRAASAIVARLKDLPEEKKDMLLKKLVSISRVNLSSNLGKELILSWDEVREMSNNGITIGAHGVTHAALSRLPLEEARSEIIESKRHIEGKLDQAVTAFSYPSGRAADFNEGVREILRESGFAYAVTVAPTSLVSSGTDLYELGRIWPGWNVSTLKFSLSGLMPHLQAVANRIRTRWG